MEESGKKKKKKKSPLVLVFFLLFLGVFGFSAYKVGTYFWDSYQTKKAFAALSAEGITENNEEGSVSVQRIVAEPGTKKEKVEEELLTFKIPFTVDFDTLREQNGDIAGWLYCEGTNIDYPVMHCSSNDEYLHRRPDKSYSSGGTLFIDCMFPPDLSAFNTIIYGHNMRDGSMFGRLKDFQKQEFFEEHPYMFYFSPYGDYLLEIAGAYQSNMSSYLYAGLPTELEKTQFLSDLKDLSDIETKVPADRNVHYITLSTCTYEEKNARYVVVCRVTKINVEGSEVTKK